MVTSTSEEKLEELPRGPFIESFNGDCEFELKTWRGEVMISAGEPIQMPFR